MLYGAMNFPIRPVLDELEAIADLGFDYLELAMDAPEGQHSSIRSRSDEILKALARHKMGIVCHLPSFVSTADLSEDLRAASVAEMMKSLEVAALLQAGKVVMHPSYVQGLGVFVKDLARKYAMDSTEAIVERADQLGLQLCLENMFPRSNALTRPDDFSEVFERFPTLKLTLDTGHANIGSGSGKRSIDFINKFSDRIGHVHVSDNFGKQDNHLPIGAGIIDFPRIVKALKRIGYDDTITFEVFARDRDYLRISREKLSAMFA